MGGGIVLVPLLVYLLGHETGDPALALRMAVGTSLSIVAVTSFFSSRAQLSAGQVNLVFARQLLPWAVFGVIAGGVCAASFSGATMLWIVIGFQMAAAAILLARLRSDASAESANLPGLAPSATACVGFIASLVGIAGGTLLVPLLYRFKMPLKRAIGTSTVLGVPIGLVGASVSIVSGLHVGTGLLPAYSLGYCYLPAFAGCAVGAMLTAKRGVAIARHLPEAHLKIACGLLLLSVSARMAWAALLASSPT